MDGWFWLRGGVEGKENIRIEKKKRKKEKKNYNASSTAFVKG